MSLHKSKGLTSKVVFVLGCVAGLIPTIKDEKELIDTNQTEALERLRAEAKRLFFVALTRTKKYLILSSFRQVNFGQAMKLNIKFTSTRGSRVAFTQTSPFFSEVARHLPQITTGDDLLNKFQIH
jgi:superfamily I DNA/RNA helicase